MQSSAFKEMKRAAGEPVPKASKKGTAAAPKLVEDDPVYDAVRMEAATDARAQAAERALTDEERTERERVKLQALEQARKLAAHNSLGGNEVAEAAAALAAAKAMGGYAGRREVARLEVCSSLPPLFLQS